MRKKLLSLSILLLFVVSVLSVNIKRVSALEYPAIYVEPQLIQGSDYIVGTLFTVAIKTDYNGPDVTAYQLTLSYDPNILRGVEVTNGDLITTDKYPDAKFLAGPFDKVAGKLSLTVAFFDTEGEVTFGPGTLAKVTFKPVGIGTSKLEIGPETKLIGWDPWREPPLTPDYNIIDAQTMPNNIQHGSFDNTGAPAWSMPVAVITASDREYVNEPVTFSGANSYDPDGTTISSYEWDFGDRTTGTGKAIDHTYTTIGIYTVTLVVTDGQNQVSDPAYHTISIEARPAYAADLSGKKAWPEHRHLDISTHGTIITLYAKVQNIGTETVTVKVKFTIFSARVGALLETIETSAAELTSLGTTVLTADFNTATWGTGKYYVKAQCFYLVGTEWFAGATIKTFSFAVVP